MAYLWQILKAVCCASCGLGPALPLVLASLVGRACSTSAAAACTLGGACLPTSGADACTQGGCLPSSSAPCPNPRNPFGLYLTHRLLCSPTLACSAPFFSPSCCVRSSVSRVCGPACAHAMRTAQQLRTPCFPRRFLLCSRHDDPFLLALPPTLPNWCPIHCAHTQHLTLSTPNTFAVLIGCCQRQADAVD